MVRLVSREVNGVMGGVVGTAVDRCIVTVEMEGIVGRNEVVVVVVVRQDGRKEF